MLIATAYIYDCSIIENGACKLVSEIQGVPSACPVDLYVLFAALIVIVIVGVAGFVCGWMWGDSPPPAPPRSPPLPAYSSGLEKARLEFHAASDRLRESNAAAREQARAKMAGGRGGDC